MIDTSIQPTVRLDLSRAITLLDPTVERRNRRWGTSPAAEISANEPESGPAWRPLPDGPNRVRPAPARQDNAHAHQSNAPRQNDAGPRPGNLPPRPETTQAGPVPPDTRSGTRAVPQASLRKPGEDGMARACGPGDLSGAESRSPESLNETKLRQSSPHAAAHPSNDDAGAPEPQFSETQFSGPLPSGPQLSTTKPEAPPEKANRPSPLKLAGFPEACVEQPLTKPSSPGRAPEAGFLKAAPGSDSGAYRDLPAGRLGARREDNPPEASAALPAPVRILFKPRPRYPEEALRSHLQGEVLLDVEFRYSGTIEVLGVRRGLGLGLNECAIEAARKLRFVPARRDGRPVDTQATLRIRFQLLQ